MNVVKWNPFRELEEMQNRLNRVFNVPQGEKAEEPPVGALDEVVAMDADKDVFGRVYLGFKGSGWRFGQPSACKPGPYTFGEAEECYFLGP